MPFAAQQAYGGNHGRGRNSGYRGRKNQSNFHVFCNDPYLIPNIIIIFFKEKFVHYMIFGFNWSFQGILCFNGTLVIFTNFGQNCPKMRFEIFG